MTDRWLPSDEWTRLADIFAREDSRLPHPDAARIRVIEDNDRIVAFLVVQLVPHAEPIWIDPEYRGRAWWPKMLGAVEAEVPGVYVFAPNEHIARMAESMNLTEKPWRVYQRQEGF